MERPVIVGADALYLMLKPPYSETDEQGTHHHQGRQEQEDQYYCLGVHIFQLLSVYTLHILYTPGTWQRVGLICLILSGN